MRRKQSAALQAPGEEPAPFWPNADAQEDEAKLISRLPKAA